MDTARKIYQHVKRLPEPLAQEVMDFVRYLEFRSHARDVSTESLKTAQEPVMTAIWDNAEDEIWDDL